MPRSILTQVRGRTLSDIAAVDVPTLGVALSAHWKARAGAAGERPLWTRPSDFGAFDENAPVEQAEIREAEGVAASVQNTQSDTTPALSPQREEL